MMPSSLESDVSAVLTLAESVSSERAAVCASVASCLVAAVAILDRSAFTERTSATRLVMRLEYLGGTLRSARRLASWSARVARVPTSLATCGSVLEAAPLMSLAIPVASAANALWLGGGGGL